LPSRQALPIFHQFDTRRTGRNKAPSTRQPRSIPIPWIEDRGPSLDGSLVLWERMTCVPVAEASGLTEPMAQAQESLPEIQGVADEIPSSRTGSRRLMWVVASPIGAPVYSPIDCRPITVEESLSLVRLNAEEITPDRRKILMLCCPKRREASRQRRCTLPVGTIIPIGTVTPTA